MVKYLGIRVVAAIMLAAYSAIDIGLNAQGMSGVGKKWVPLVTIIAFVLLMFWIVYDLKRANERLLDNRPKITVQIVEEGDTYFLNVHNEGAEGLFRAQMQLIAEDPAVLELSQLSRYAGCWKLRNGAETRILEGQADLLKVAERYSSRPPGPISQHLKFWFFDGTANSAKYVSTSTHWLGATITSEDGSVRPLTKDEYKLLVTISASPSLREGVYQEQYRATIDGIEVDSAP